VLDSPLASRRPRSLALASTLCIAIACGDDSSATDQGASSSDTGTTSGDPGSTDDATSTDSGADPTSSDSADPDSSGGDGSSTEDTGTPTGDPVIFAVGYGGIRVRSLDDGVTWTDHVQLADDGQDDMNLLRGAAWGNDRFVAVGFRIFSSPDAVEWTEHDNPTGQWYGAVQFGNDMFLAVGGGGYCARSTDAEAWETCTDATDDAGFTHVRSVLFLDDLFYTSDDIGVLRSTSDGDAWTVVEPSLDTAWVGIMNGQLVPLDQNAPADLPNARLRGQGGAIWRAEPGSDDFTSVYTVPNGNSVFQAYRFAFAQGYVN
jgi:hypothetical protein